MIFFENECVESGAIIERDFCYSYIEGYGGRGLLICDVIFRERVSKFVT